MTYDELAIASEHVVTGPIADARADARTSTSATGADLPPIHKDPFDRLLVAQSTVEGILLLTADPIVAQYPGPIRKV